VIAGDLSIGHHPSRPRCGVRLEQTWTNVPAVAHVLSISSTSFGSMIAVSVSSHDRIAGGTASAKDESLRPSLS